MEEIKKTKIIVKIVERPMYTWVCPNCGTNVLSRCNPMSVHSESCTFCGNWFNSDSFVTIIEQ